MGLAIVDCIGNEGTPCPISARFFQKNSRHARCAGCQKQNRKIMVARNAAAKEAAILPKPRIRQQERLSSEGGFLGALSVVNAMLRAE